MVDSYKYLGITLETALTFKKELNKVISRVNHKIWILGHFRTCFDDKTSVIILKAMLLPYIDNSIWFFTSISLLDQKRLQILQNTALRVCFQIYDPQEISVKKLHEKAGILPMYLRRKYLQGVLCYRMISIGALDLVDNRPTRAADGPLLRTYLTHTERIRKSPPVNAINEWNIIPPSVKTL